MMTRVKLISPLPPPAGGIARWTSLIMSHADSRSAVELSVLNTALRWRAVTENSTAARIGAGVPQIIQCSASLLWDLLKRRIDVVHINSSGQFGLARDLILASLSRLFGVPVILHVRFGRVPQIIDTAGYEWRLFAALVAKANSVIAIDSKTSASLAERFPHLGVHLIPNCIDTSDLATVSSTKPEGCEKYVLFAGSLLPTKGVGELVAAWRALQIDGWTLVLAGAYNDLYLKRLELKHGDNGNIKVLGEVEHSEILRLVDSCEIFALPSHTEGFPNSVLEAMSLGKAIVSCDVGAVGDMLRDGCGQVVPVADPDALGAAISGLLLDPRERRRLGRNAAARAVADYSLPTVFGAYSKLWRELGKPVMSSSSRADVQA